MVCSPIVFHCKCIIPLQIEDWLITQRNCGHVVDRVLFIHGMHAMHSWMQAPKFKMCAAINIPNNFLLLLCDCLLACWLAGWQYKLLKERNLFLTLQQLDYIFIFIFLISIISIIIIMNSSSSSSSSAAAQISSSCPLVLKISQLLLAANLGGKFFMCEIYLGFVDDGGEWVNLGFS